MKHFNPLPETVEQAKKIYRELAKINHPDKGGELNIMQEINNEYDFICAKILRGENLSFDDYNDQWTSSQMFKEKINAIVNIEGIIIEIVGLWIWVTGNTRPVKDQIKEAGFWFASKKVAWYWRPEHAAGGRGKHSLDELKIKYGCERINGSYKYQLA